MSKINLTIYQQKQRLLEQARICLIKANNTSNYRQKVKLRHKANELTIKANNLLMNKLRGSYEYIV